MNSVNGPETALAMLIDLAQLADCVGQTTGHGNCALKV
jgi:hypothetical protein